MRRTREVWASCCGHHEVLPKDAPPEAQAVLEAPHHPEPKPYDGYCCHMGAMSAPVPRNRPELIKCPWCGHLAKVKELGRTGKRDNLTAWRRVVVLRQSGGPVGNRLFYQEILQGGADGGVGVGAVPGLPLQAGGGCGCRRAICPMGSYAQRAAG